MIRIFRDTNIDFQGKRRIAMAMSAVIILISLISLIMHKGPNYSIDFEGGLSILMRFDRSEEHPPVSEEMVRTSLNSIGLGNSEVKMSRSAEGEDILIRIKEEARFRHPETLIRAGLDNKLTGAWRAVPLEELSSEGAPDLSGYSYVAVLTTASNDVLTAILDSVDVDDRKIVSHKTINGKPVAILMGKGRDAVSKLRAALAHDFPEYGVDMRSIDRVGPRIGSELRVQAIGAIIAALTLIIIYLWWRFGLYFGFAAVVALFHDVMITLGIFSIFNIEISVTIIGAFLTLVGYSLNDTIVVFDRIRENIKRYRDKSYASVVNTSINQTLSRTIITSGTTLMVVLVLFIFGGEVLHSFALALLIGIVVGTYSSIFIASPILIEWAERTGKAAGRKASKK